LVARRGDAAPGLGGETFFRFSELAVNDLGEPVFVGQVRGGGVTTANDQGLWAEVGGSFGLVAREGDAAPGLGDAGIVFAEFSEIKINDKGEVLFLARVTGGSPPVDAASDDALYGWSAGGGLQLIAAEGEVAPGTAGVFYRLTGYSAHEGGDLAFNGTLRNGVGGVTRRSDHGVWTVSSLGAPANLLIQSGDDFDDADGDGDDEKIHRVFVTSSDDGGTGGRSGAVACGNVAVVVTYDQNRQTAVWVLGIPD
jgi:hypothetical protein